MFPGSDQRTGRSVWAPGEGAGAAHGSERWLIAVRQRSRRAVLLALSVCLLAIVACERTGPSFQQMGRQPKYDPLEASDFFADGQSARPRMAGTVARGELSTDPFLDTGKIAGADGDGLPFPMTQQILDRGNERFNIFCSECHGRAGDGNGMIPSRGFRRPPSFHTESLRTAKTGHFFDVMTNGFGSMPSYAAQVPVKDRWAIIAYIRALQLSQNAAVADVPQASRAELGGGVPR